jgi:ParB/RepB/Spo0J family partition protein
MTDRRNKMKMELKNIEINSIVVNPRIREELGDIDALSNSIHEFGLITPLLINKNQVLISGLRRLEACKKLGHTHIQAIIVDIEDENLLFHIESQENLCRKSLTPSEIDKEIEMKRRFALDKIRAKSFLGNIWNKIRNIFKKKRK